MELVRGAAAGDRDARRRLFELHRESAYVVAARIVGADEALDVVQDAFIRAFERLREFDRNASFRTWLLRIVTNRALDVLRSRHVRRAVPLDAGADDAVAVRRGEDPGGPDPAEHLERQELSERIERALATLPAPQRAVLALYATGEMTYGQIAEVLGVPIGTVMSRLYHARRRLQEMLRDLAGGEGREPAK